MKPPLRQIATQVSKVEVSWPATLPLPRIAPLMSKIAGMMPDLPSPSPRSQPFPSGLTLPPPTPPASLHLPGMITDIAQLNNRPAALSMPKPIFESAVEIVPTPGPTDFSRIMKLDFE